MKPAPFQYVRAATLAEALAYLAQSGGDAKLLAGGQSLIPVLNFRLARPPMLIDIGRVPELHGITALPGGGLRIGAMVRHCEIERSALVGERAPLLAEAAGQIGHPAIRNRGTIGGSLCHADPAAEFPAACRALDAELVIAGPEGERRCPAHDFFLTIFTTTLGADELLVAIEFPPPAARGASAVVEVARRHGDFALTGAMVRLDLEPAGRRCAAARVVLFGVADIPWRAEAAEAALVGSVLDAEAATAAAARAPEGIDMPSDLHATAEYRQEVAAVCVRRALTVAFDRLVGKPVPTP